jgi:hypothetical protein
MDARERDFAPLADLALGSFGTEFSMRRSKTGRIAAIATGLMLAVAAPAAFAQSHGGGGGGHGGGFSGGGHFSGGHSFGGHGFSGGGRSFGGGGGFRGGHDFHHGFHDRGFGFAGGAFLGGLALGSALDYPYYGAPYYDYGYDDAYGPGQCLTEQQVWDPRYGRYIVREVPYPC